MCAPREKVAPRHRPSRPCDRTDHMPRSPDAAGLSRRPCATPGSNRQRPLESKSPRHPGTPFRDRGEAALLTMESSTIRRFMIAVWVCTVTAVYWHDVFCLAGRTPPDPAWARRRAGLANPLMSGETGLTGDDPEGSRSGAQHARRGPPAARHARLRGGRNGKQLCTVADA